MTGCPAARHIYIILLTLMNCSHVFVYPFQFLFYINVRSELNGQQFYDGYKIDTVIVNTPWRNNADTELINKTDVWSVLEKTYWVSLGVLFHFSQMNNFRPTTSYFIKVKILHRHKMTILNHFVFLWCKSWSVFSTGDSVEFFSSWKYGWEIALHEKVSFWKKGLHLNNLRQPAGLPIAFGVHSDVTSALAFLTVLSGITINALKMRDTRE